MRAAGVLLILALALGAAEKEDRLPTVADAAVVAYADLRALPAESRPFQRYVWVPNGKREDRQAVAFAVNLTARRPDPVKYVQVTDWLIRYDLRAVAPLIDDLGDWLQTWEELRFDPAFSLLVTPDARKLNGIEVLEVRRFFLWGGNGFPWEMRPEVVREAKGVVRLNGPLPDAYTKLQDECLTESPIVDAGYLLTRMLTTIQGQGGSRDVFSGLYYRFAGIKKAKQGTDEDLFLRRLGVLKEDEKATAFFEALGSDAKAAMYRSGVTKKPRRVDWLPTRGSLTGGWVSITHDPSDKDMDLTKHPMYALADLKDAAREVIASRANGLHLFALFNAKGELQDEAPPDVVRDSKVPEGFTDRLQPAISCIRCHGVHDGIQPVTNDVQAMVRRGVKFIGFDGTDTLGLLESKYKADPSRLIARGRDDYNRGVLAAIDGWLPSKQGNADIVTLASKHVSDIYAAYNYDAVDARAVLADLGYRPPLDNAAASLMLAKVVPVAIDKPLTVAEVDLVHLQGGGVLGRFEYSLSRGYIAGRVKK